MTSRTAQRRIMAALLLSLGLNLFFVGGIAARFTLGLGAPDASNRPLPPTLSWITNDLEPERRRELRDSLRQRTRESRDARANLAQRQRETTRLMLAEPFDQAALAAAFAELRDASDAYQTIAHRQTAAVLGELSSEERQRAVQFLARRGPREENGGRPPGRPRSLPTRPQD